MTEQRISRNDPCPCGSGKKFKHCCISKGIDWRAKQAAGLRSPLPAVARHPAARPGLTALGPFRVVDARLKEIAAATPGPAGWKSLVERLSAESPDEERVRAYRAIRAAGVLPGDAAFFLFGHAVQWMPPEDGGDDLDQHTLRSLRRFGLDDLADLYANNSREADRRHERGRQFFFGPPDEEAAERLRKQGVID